MGSRVLQAIARGCSLKTQNPIRSLYSCSAATIHSSPNSSSALQCHASQIWQHKPWSPSSARTRSLSASSGSSKVLLVNSDAEFSNVLSKAQDNQGLAIAYFTATWCGPCRAIAPIVENLSTSYPNVTILKLDIDLETLSNSLQTSGVTSVPTFHFYKNGEKVADLVGADPHRLKEIVGNLAKWLFSIVFMQICWEILENINFRVETWTRQVTNPSTIASGSPS